jgi:phosphopantothenoylcysteine decarboxylase/phosphopantothenate--cysteine ligase
VGFAAETGDASGTWLEHGRAKLAKYGVDLLVVNEVGADLTFGADHSAAVVISADGSEEPVPDGPKERLADVIWDRVLKARSRTD